VQKQITFEDAKARKARAATSGLVLVGEDGSVADLVFLYFSYGFVGFVHGEALGDGFDIVSGGDVEHFG